MTERAYIKEMRQRLGLKPDDKSRDREIEDMTPAERLGLICGWRLGDPYWGVSFVSWARDAGFKITEPKRSPQVTEGARHD